MFRIPQPNNSAGETTPAIVSFSPIQRSESDANALNGASKQSPCELTAAFMRQFEKISGWEIQFSRCSANSKNHTDAGQPNLTDGNLVEGNFEIIDMSSTWPARKPTLHRGDCDQLVAIFGELFAKQQSTDKELREARATLASLTNPSDDEEELVDSFLPLGPLKNPTLGSADEDWVLSEDDGETDSSFVVQQAVDSDWLTEDGTWEDWSVAGATGIAGDRYLDWSQTAEKITVFVGRLESSFGSGDAESRLEICPGSQQFRVTDVSGFSSFFAWDRRGSQLEKVKPGTWQRLPPGGAVVVSTTPSVQLPEKVSGVDCSEVSAEQLAVAIENQMDEQERLLVIKYQ
jgi:hypothetical protein